MQDELKDGAKKPHDELKDEPKSELEECKRKCDEYLNNWKRSAADFINYKKDEMERIGFLAAYAKEDILLKILPVLDSFYLAEKQLPENLKKQAREPQVNGSASSPQVEWTKGFLQIKNQISEFLKKEGIEIIEVIGKKFDPNCMEAVEQTEEGESGIVIEELQKGYKIGEKVLRPAKVKVTK